MLILFLLYLSYFSRPCNIPDVEVRSVLQEIVHKKQVRALKKEAFLSKMAEIESNSGRNTNHKLMLTGIHAGERAVGRYGLMPKTIDDMSKRLKMEGKLPGRLKKLRAEGHSTQYIANIVAEDPLLEDLITKRLYKHIYERFNGDLLLMNVSWEVGHNLSPGFNRAIIDAHPRTIRFIEK